MLAFNKNPAAEPTVQGAFFTILRSVVENEAVKNGKKGGKNRECLNCRLTVDIFDRSGEEAVRN